MLPNSDARSLPLADGCVQTMVSTMLTSGTQGYTMYSERTQKEMI